MDQADIADQVIADYLENAIAIARGGRMVAEKPIPFSLDCIECGVQIPDKRRNAIPGCKRCIDCEEDYEKRNGRSMGTRAGKDTVDDIIDDILMAQL